MNLKKMRAADAVVLVPLFYVLYLILTALAVSGGNDLFNNTMVDIADKYYLEANPDMWAFIMWGIIWVWQALWMAYGLATLCIRGVNGKLYYHPAIIPPAVYMIFVLNMASFVVWLFMWDREYLVGAFVAVLGIPIPLYFCIGLSALKINKLYDVLVAHDLTKHVWLVRFLLQNGMACYATWSTFDIPLSFGLVLAYVADMDQKDASTIVLVLLIVMLIAWLLLDVYVLDRWARYIFIPYFVMVFVACGIISANFSVGGRNTVLSFVLLVVSIATLITKLIVLRRRHINNPEGAIELEETPKEQLNSDYKTFDILPA